MAPRLCSTCKWCVNPGEYAECGSPKNVKKPSNVERLTGFREHKGAIYKYCSTQRFGVGFLDYLFPLGDCGSRGRWWEPAE